MGAVSRVLKLNTGKLMPSLGLGTYQLTGNHLKEVIDRAVFLGYRMIDTAHTYGNEKDIGDMLYQFNKSGTVKRKHLFLTTKVPDIYHAPSDVRYAVDESLENIKTKCLDLVLIHHPWSLKNRGDGTIKPFDKDGKLEFETQNLTETWKVLCELQKEGKTQSVGVSNFTVKQIEKLIDGSQIVPANVQLECHAYLQQREIKMFCESRGITVTAYSPLGAPGRPENHYTEENSISLLKDDCIKTIARQYHKSPAQILLRFLLQRDFAILPKTQKFDRLKENISVFDFEIGKGDMESIAKLDRNLRYFPFLDFRNHPEFYLDEQF